MEKIIFQKTYNIFPQNDDLDKLIVFLTTLPKSDYQKYEKITLRIRTCLRISIFVGKILCP